MPDVLTPEQRHRNMVAIHSSSTKPELKLRTGLWRQGFRYRVNDKHLPGSPDIVVWECQLKERELAFKSSLKRISLLK